MCLGSRATERRVVALRSDCRRRRAAFRGAMRCPLARAGERSPTSHSGAVGCAGVDLCIAAEPRTAELGAAETRADGNRSPGPAYWSGAR